MPSEVDAMCAIIELECQALRHMMLPASVASHEIIRKKYASVERRVEELKALVGEQDANTIACEIYCRVIG